jgi:hypothetical protein
MLYDIRWFDTTKSGKLVVRKYQGKIPWADVECEYWMVKYRGKIKLVRKADCLANVWKDGRWQRV